jgi:hypothetical protein
MPVSAQSANCNSHQAVAERLFEGYGEYPVSVAIGAGGVLVETWANLETGSWSITVTEPGGLTCLVASGELFQLVDLPIPGEEM